jgi:hypothetical protein
LALPGHFNAAKIHLNRQMDVIVVFRLSFRGSKKKGSSKAQHIGHARTKKLFSSMDYIIT